MKNTSRYPGGKLINVFGIFDSSFSYAEIISILAKLKKIKITANFSLSVLLPPLCFIFICKFKLTSEP